jgi:MFS family permease
VAAADVRPGYRDVLAVAEFRALLGCEALSVVGDQVARVAVALLVYARTESALAASATYAASYLTWLAGGAFLSTFADRYRRRGVMVVCDIARAAVFTALAFSGGTTALVLGLLVAGTLFAPPFESARSAVLADVLTGDAYAAGNGLINAVAQAGQAVGFLVGGALVAAAGSRNALLVDAATFALSAVVLQLTMKDRPLPRDLAQRPTIRADLVEGLQLVSRSPQLRWLLGVALVGAAMVTAPEGLAVPLAADHGGGAFAAGVLTAALPVGFVVGSLIVLRLPEHRRLRSLPALLLLSGVPLLCTPLMPGVASTAALWALAGVGASLQVVANAAYVQATPVDLRGRAFGIASTLLLGIQGVVYLLAGVVAEAIDTAVVVAALAAAGLLAMPGIGLLARSRDEMPQASGRSRRA